MALTSAGASVIAAALTGNAFPTYSNANSRIGVGDSAAAFAAGQTDLLGADKFRKGMEAAYPTLAGAVMTFRSLFAPSEAVFVWNEWGIFNAASGPTMLSRKVESLGTKPGTQSWQLTVELTVGAA